MIMKNLSLSKKTILVLIFTAVFLCMNFVFADLLYPIDGVVDGFDAQYLRVRQGTQLIDIKLSHLKKNWSEDYRVPGKRIKTTLPASILLIKEEGVKGPAVPILSLIK